MSKKFFKKDSVKLKRVRKSWRKPTGKKNKVKVGKKGHKPMPSKGFRTPNKYRYKIGNKMPVIVHSLNEKLNNSNIVIIGSSVGKLKRQKIVESCNAKGIKVVNYEQPKDSAQISK